MVTGFFFLFLFDFFCFFFFFFQAEDGIRDDLVTGVQTCALPISVSANIVAARGSDPSIGASHSSPLTQGNRQQVLGRHEVPAQRPAAPAEALARAPPVRDELGRDATEQAPAPWLVPGQRLLLGAVVAQTPARKSGSCWRSKRASTKRTQRQPRWRQ